MRRGAALLACSLALATVSCGSPSRTVIDLAEALPRAGNHPETRLVDLGAPDARPHLVAGLDERDRPVEVLRSRGRVVVLEIEVAVPRMTTVTVRARAREQASTPLRLSVEGVEVGELTLEDRYREHAVRVPGRLWARGTNRLELRVPEGVPLPEAIDWDWIALDRESEFDAAPAALREDASREVTLEIPYGTRVDFPLRLPESPRLRVAALRASGTRGSLEVRVTADGDGGVRELLRRRVEVGPGDVSLDWPLPRPDEGIVRLALRPVPEVESGVAAGGLLLSDARVRGGDRAPASVAAAGAPEPPPPIVVFMVDTLRADRLGTYGHGRPTSPRIDRFAAERGVLFESALAQSSWTKPAVASIFTGTHPSTHGVVDRDTMLVDGAETMAEILGSAGYETAGFVTITTVASIFGFDQGFDLYAEMLEEPTLRIHQPAGRVVDAALEWIDSREETTRPFLLYVHVADPHTPYVPPDAQRRRFAAGVDPRDPASFAGNLTDWQPGPEDELERFRSAASDLYDAEVAYVDEQFGRFLDGLRERRLLDPSAVVLVSDHGEEFHEHGGWTHGHTLYQEQLHVPLIVQLPGARDAGRRVEATVRQVDLLPTLLELAGIPASPRLQGSSLLPLLRGDGESRRARSHLRLGDREQDALVDGRWKLVVDAAAESGPTIRLFDLAADPGERADLSLRRPVTVDYLRSWLDETARRFRSVAVAAEDTDLPADVEARLRALGYIR